MQQSKFSLADVLTVLGAFAFGFFCFLSFNFLSLGETMQSVVWASVLALVLGGLAFGAKLLKMSSINFTTCIIFEWIFLFLFAGMAFIAVYPFSHYYAVSDYKNEIQQKVIGNITQAEGMFTEYEVYANNRLNIYKSKLNSVVAAKNISPSEYRDYGFVVGADDRTQVENKMFTLKAQLFPTNFIEMKQVDSSWLASSKTIIADWKPISLIDVINDVEGNLTEWKNKLIEYSSFRAKGETTTDFDFPLNFDDVTNRMETLGSPTTISIVIAISLYVLLLLPYLVTKRSTKTSYPSLFFFLTRKSSSYDSEVDIKF